MENVTSKVFLKNMSNFIGAQAGSTIHKRILQEYGMINPLPRNYMPTMNDPWCAIFVSAMWKYLGPNKWFPYECSCTIMIQKLEAEGLFRYADSIHDSSELNPGWLIFYDWERDGSPDHVGFIEEVRADIITTIEGNYRNQVWNGQLDFGDKRIYGYGILQYDNDESETEKAIKFVSDNRIMRGNGTVDYWDRGPTRKQLAVILYRLYQFTKE